MVEIAKTFQEYRGPGPLTLERDLLFRELA